ncbi:MAG: hypothetical protein ACK5GI_06755 [Ignavibacteria bacterium]|jgi:outer membrane protein OmpA-like peptidoglycan-associated protein/nitrogen fixation-related uncharacterized protein
MLLRRHMPYVIATLLLWCPLLYAQRVSVGPIAQGAINIPYASFPSLTDVPVCCSNFGLGAGLGANLGLELLADVHPAASLGLRAMVGGARDVLWTNDQIGWTLRRTSAGNKVYPSYSTYVLDVTSIGLDVSGLANVHLGASSPWSISVGVGVMSAVSMKYDQYENLDDDASQILSDSRRPQRDVSAGDITSRAAAHGRLIAGLRYDDNNNRSSRLFYDVTANVGIDPVLESGGGSLTAFSVRATVGILFDLYSASDTIVPEPPKEIVAMQEPAPEVAPDPIPEVAQPEAPVQPAPVIEPAPSEVPALEPAPTRVLAPVQVEVPPTVKDPVLIEYATAYQLLPYIFFVPGTSNIDERSHAIAPDKDIQRAVDTAWTQETYTKRHELLHRHLLDVIGYRMSRVYPEAHLLINGYINGRASDSAVMKYGYARAQVVSEYLQLHWGIEAGRLRVSSTERMSPTACTYALREARDILDAEEENTRCEISSPDEPRLMSSVIARASVAENTLTSLQHTNIVRILSLPTLEGASLIAATGPLRPARIVSSVVIGFTDRKGPENINQRISEQRARKAAALIDGQSGVLSIDWIGEGARGMRAPYTNDSPLGRLLNRCAELRRTWVSSQR